MNDVDQYIIYIDASPFKINIDLRFGIIVNIEPRIRSLIGLKLKDLTYKRRLL